MHIADSGKIRLIEGHVNSAGGTIEFEASDFSLYGIAGSDQSIDSLLGAQAARDVMPWIIAGANRSGDPDRYYRHEKAENQEGIL